MAQKPEQIRSKRPTGETHESSQPTDSSAETQRPVITNTPSSSSVAKDEYKRLQIEARRFIMEAQAERDKAKDGENDDKIEGEEGKLQDENPLYNRAWNRVHSALWLRENMPELLEPNPNVQEPRAGLNEDHLASLQALRDAIGSALAMKSMGAAERANIARLAGCLDPVRSEER